MPDLIPTNVTITALTDPTEIEAARTRIIELFQDPESNHRGNLATIAKLCNLSMKALKDTLATHPDLQEMVDLADEQTTLEVEAQHQNVALTGKFSDDDEDDDKVPVTNRLQTQREILKAKHERFTPKMKIDKTERKLSVHVTKDMSNQELMQNLKQKISQGKKK